MTKIDTLSLDQFASYYEALQVAVHRELDNLDQIRATMTPGERERRNLLTGRTMAKVSVLAVQLVHEQDAWPEAWRALREQWPITASRLEPLLRAVWHRETTYLAATPAQRRTWQERFNLGDQNAKRIHDPSAVSENHEENRTASAVGTSNSTQTTANPLASP